MMSLVNSALNPVKQFIHQKRHKPAIEGYLARQRAALNDDIKRKLAHFKDKSVAVRFDVLPDAKPISGISVQRRDLPTAKVGEPIVLVHLESKQQVARGQVVSVNLNLVKIKLSRPVLIKNNNRKSRLDKKEYRIKFDQRSVLEKRFRAERALRKFKTVNCSVKLHKIMLCNYKDWSNVKYKKARVVSLEGSACLRGAQLVAVEQSMIRRISLIEGVAGSGKTLVAANLAYSMNKFRKRRILLCSPMESTVNKLGEILAKTNEVLVVKLTGNDPEKNKKMSTAKTIAVNSTSTDCSLVSLVDEALYNRMWKRCVRAVAPSAISSKQKASFNQQTERFVANCSPWLRRKMERKILKKADIVCCTLAQVGSQLMRGLKFEMLIIDDMQVAKEIDCIMPMMIKGIKQVTLLSDMRRDIRCARFGNAKFWPKMNGFVPAFFPKDERKKLEKSVKLEKHPPHQEKVHANIFETDCGGLFERWLSIGLTAVALKYQYRMHECLAAFPNHHYYLSRLKTDTATNIKLTRQIFNNPAPADDRFKWLPNNKCPTAIFDTFTQQNSIKDTVKSVLDNLISKENIRPIRISVITNNTLESDYGYDDVEVGTVIDYYGQERDFVVLACHQAINEKLTLDSDQSVDYLKNDNALNVALTRAKVGLFIVADLSNLIAPSVIDEIQSFAESSPEDGVPQPESAITTNYRCCKSWRTLVKYYLANKLVA